MTRYFMRRLQAEHARLDEAVARELRRLGPDEPTLRELKRRKLQVKDRLRALEMKAATEGLHA
ncbi:YdcH family protein [Brevundimonas vitis]|uniref:YdcH family protein n=1 Tax=Brevundimonas vitisensis TaxID=2800818 RepID=A0ABX7BM01_9CAUL|nr:YdcH family protein [Brevundimonas vitisensis]QQQ18605.1 YdcH family protein [Brevundimonas vitisensis]